MMQIHQIFYIHVITPDTIYSVKSQSFKSNIYIFLIYSKNQVCFEKIQLVCHKLTKYLVLIATIKFLSPCTGIFYTCILYNNLVMPFDS